MAKRGWLVLGCLVGCGGSDLEKVHLGPQLQISVGMFCSGNGRTVSSSCEELAPPPRPAELVALARTFDSASGRFRVHYDVTGDVAVPADDVDGSGVPDIVERDAVILDTAVARYAEWGFLPPVATAPIDVYLHGRYLFAKAGLVGGMTVPEGASCRPSPGYIVMLDRPIDDTGLAKLSRQCATAHEVFHLVQFAYGRVVGSELIEGSAMWAEAAVLPECQTDAASTNYLSTLDTSLTSKAHAAGPFFLFLGEKYGPQIIREIWEAVAAKVSPVAAGEQVTLAFWYDALDQILRARHQSTLADSFVLFNTWRMFTGTFADPDRGWRNGDMFPPAIPASESVGALPVYGDLPVCSFGGTFVVRAGRPDRKYTVAISSPTVGLEGLRGILATRSNDDVLDVVTWDPSIEDAPTVTSGSQVVVGVVDTSVQSRAQFVDVCIGGPDDISACE